MMYLQKNLQLTYSFLEKKMKGIFCWAHQCSFYVIGGVKGTMYKEVSLRGWCSFVVQS